MRETRENALMKKQDFHTSWPLTQLVIFNIKSLQHYRNK